jgi:glycosyltransferase involved in cell wall biosynthesis
MRYPRIVLDLGGLDHLRPGTGLFRYIVDLVHSLVELDPPAHFIVFGAHPEPIAALGPVFARPGNRCEYFYFPRSTGFAAAYRDYARLALALATVRADLCHCLNTFAPVVSPCPLVVTIHDMMYELFPEYAEGVRSRPYRIFRWVVRRNVRRVLCSSQTTADDLVRLWKVSPRRINVVPLGVRVFNAAEGFLEPKNEVLMRLGPGPVISSPLNLEPRKNLITLLQAFAQIHAKNPDAQLVVYGKAGWSQERERLYRANLNRLGLAGLVREPGIVDDTDLWYLYHRTSVFVFPSLYEGFGYPVVEAMAAGACPVVRGCSSMAEAVGSAGVQLEPFTSPGLASAVSELLGDEPRRRALAAAAVSRAAQFTSRRMAEGTFSAYDRALRWNVARV